MIELISCFPILIQLIRNKTFLKGSPEYLRLFIYCVFWSSVSLFVFESIRQVSGWIGFEYYVDKSAFISGSSFLCGVVFLCGCAMFINDIDRIKMLFVIIILSGFELFIEALFYQVLQLDLPRAVNVAGEGLEGRFLSLIFGSYQLLVNVCFAAIGACLYFFSQKRNYYMILLLFSLFIPIFVTYQRSPIVAGLVIIGGFYILSGKSIKHLLMRLVLVFGPLLLAGIYYEVIVEYFLSKNILMITDARPYYFAVESYMGSWESRIGASIRGVELLIASFPFGLGVDDIRFYQAMASSSVDSLLVQFLPHSASATSTYLQIITNERSTDPHNWFIKYIAEYGAVGSLTVCSLFLGFMLNLKKFLKNTYHFKDTSINNLYLMRITGLSVILGMMVYSLYQAFILYSLLFFFVFLSFFRYRQPKSSKLTIYDSQ